MFRSQTHVSMSMSLAVMMLMILGTGLDAAPTERGFVKTEKSPALDPGQFLKHWLLSTRAAGLDRTTTRTITTGVKAQPARTDKRSQMLKMISALEELHRTLESSSRITIVPRANSRNPGRKSKAHAPPVVDGALRSSTVAPVTLHSTASSGPRDDVIVPSLNGRNFRKSLPPQSKKTNKRVCFWKYCSQN